MRLHTFYRPDGTEFRCRAEVVAGPVPSPTQTDGCTVLVATVAAARKFTGGETWGLGRFAPVLELKVG